MTVVNPYEALEKMFHEPNRLAIMSALCASVNGMTFVGLKDICGLTDGNLNRHLKVLQEAGVIKNKKEFVASKPRTTVLVTVKGINRFNDYIGALSAVLDRAKKAIPAEKKAVSASLSGAVKA
jgi:DNA-binding transcriptional ArsR family regulator